MEKTASHAATETTVWRLDADRSRVRFRVSHLGFAGVTGEFRDFDVHAQFDPGDLSTLSVRGTVKVASIDTGNDTRDQVLRSQFFAADRFPDMTFGSKRVEQASENRARIVGDLTIRNATKEVVFDVKQTGDSSDLTKMEVSTTLSKRDLRGTWRDLTHGVGSLFGIEVTITMELGLVHAV